MSKKNQIRYVSEEAVKKALKISSFRNMSKDKIMQFASMLPYMNQEVAIAAINQFPVYKDFAEIAINTYKQVCDQILENNRESELAVIQGYQTILNSLSKRMERDDITEKERKEITEDMLKVAKEISIVDERNKKFLEKISSNVKWVMLTALVLLGSAIGISSQMSAKDDLPEIDDNSTEDDEKE